MPQPFISICIPVYNGQHYLKECLDSCLSQQYEHYEVVICDDGSRDESPSIIGAYAQQHKRIKHFKNEKNLGLVGNWNRCIEMAEGEWIKFVFQDDYITPDCLHEFVAAIRPNSVLLMSERHFILPNKPTLEELNYYNDGVKTLTNTGYGVLQNYSATLLARISVQNMCMNFIGEPSLSLFRRDLVTKLGYFNPVLKQICDLEFLLRVGSNYGLTYVPKKLCAFRIHANSTTSTNVSTKFFELHYIEPIVFASLLLFDKQFEHFRKSLTVFQLFKLKLYFKVKTYRAYKVHEQEGRNHPLLNGASSEIKQIAQIKKGNFWIHLLERFL